MVKLPVPPTVILTVLMLGAMLWVVRPALAQESRIAFVSDRVGNPDIYVFDSDGSDLRRLTTHPGIDRAPAWSPDGQQLAFISDRLGSAGIFLMNVQSGEVTLLLEPPPPWQSLSSSRMSWSPSGGHLAYTITETKEREIFVEVLSLRTGTTDRLQRGMAPSWSPDGSRLAFNKGQIPQIVAMPFGGGEVALLLRKPEGLFSVDLLPAWSPDGASILFTSTRGTTENDMREKRINYDVYAQGIDEDHGVRLTDSPGQDHAWGWSPDGTQFVFTTNRDGNTEVYVGDTQGGEPRNLTRDPAEDTEPSWGRVVE
jgi:TolB protein